MFFLGQIDQSDRSVSHRARAENQQRRNCCTAETKEWVRQSLLPETLVAGPLGPVTVNVPSPVGLGSPTKARRQQLHHFTHSRVVNHDKAQTWVLRPMGRHAADSLFGVHVLTPPIGFNALHYGRSTLARESVVTRMPPFLKSSCGLGVRQSVGVVLARLLPTSNPISPMYFVLAVHRLCQ